jgi:hypothetical protein
MLTGRDNAYNSIMTVEGGSLQRGMTTIVLRIESRSMTKEKLHNRKEAIDRGMMQGRVAFFVSDIDFGTMCKEH